MAAAVLALAGCSGASEHALLGQFFAACRLRDLTALSRIATTVFEPRERGTVLEFDVAGVRPTGSRTKDVTVSALVRLPGGETVRQTLIVALEQRPDGRWMVAAVR